MGHAGPPDTARWLLKCTQVIMKKLFFLMVCISSLLLTSCSEQPQTVAKKEPEKPAEPASGQSALFKMYQVARASWSGDAQVLKLNSIHLADVPAVPGKAGAWQATFTSEKLAKSRTFTYSVVEQEGNLHKGVFALQEEGWSGKQGINTSFDIRSVSIDSDAAYRTAIEKAGDYDKKNPGMTISFQLEKINKFTTPVWRIIWGESAGTSNFSVYVDSSLGQFLEKTH
jgi:hypothetical protein